MTGRNSWGGFPIFDPQINAVFSAYRDLHAENVLARDEARRGKSVCCLTDDEFIGRYGLPPWEQISELLNDLGLPYKVKEPSWKLEKSVMLTLQRLRDDVEVEFSGLSSGERVMVRFALSIFQFDPWRVNLSVPKLLLLDEMDASLHPEMVHRWLGAIRDKLVGGRSIKCILTTHSPTTVAMAPEDALFEMVEGIPGPRKVTRQQALNRLTFGLPALSVDYDNRRQVFVESGTDAAAYELIANILKSELNLPRTLTFIATGPRHGKQERNTGSSVVEHLVGELTKHGNKSIFGILDWDGKRSSGDRIKVLAQGTHYSLDNVALNPLLIGVLLIRQDIDVAGSTVKIQDFPTLSATQAQELTDAIQGKLVYPRDAPTGTSPVRFVSGLEVKVHTAFMQSNGHEMEAVLTAAFPALKRFHPGTRGNLAEAVIQQVLTPWRQLTPEPIALIFREIAEQELA